MFPAGYTHKNALPKRSVSSRTISDYSPFGVLLPERSVNAGDFRYGFNGMEGDRELKGLGNSYTTEFRQYDPRIGRWLSVDPEKNTFESPFLSMGNNPLSFNDIYGNKIKGKNGKRLLAQYELALKGRISDIASEIVQEKSKDTPDLTKITALNSIMEGLETHLDDVTQIKESSLEYSIKKGKKYPDANGVHLNSQVQIDGAFGVDQGNKSGQLMIHPEAENFNLTMAGLVTSAALFDKGETSVAADISNWIAWGLGSNLYDIHDVENIIYNTSLWEYDINNAQIAQDVTNMSNQIDDDLEKIALGKAPSFLKDNRLFNEIENEDGYCSDGDKGSQAAQGKQTYSDFYKSDAFKNMSKDGIYYNSQENVINVHSPK